MPINTAEGSSTHQLQYPSPDFRDDAKESVLEAIFENSTHRNTLTDPERLILQLKSLDRQVKAGNFDNHPKVDFLRKNLLETSDDYRNKDTKSEQHDYLLNLADLYNKRVIEDIYHDFCDPRKTTDQAHRDILRLNSDTNHRFMEFLNSNTMYLPENRQDQERNSPLTSFLTNAKEKLQHTLGLGSNNHQANYLDQLPAGLPTEAYQAAEQQTNDRLTYRLTQKKYEHLLESREKETEAQAKTANLDRDQSLNISEKSYREGQISKEDHFKEIRQIERHNNSHLKKIRQEEGWEADAHNLFRDEIKKSEDNQAYQYAQQTLHAGAMTLWTETHPGKTLADFASAPMEEKIEARTQFLLEVNCTQEMLDNQQSYREDLEQIVQAKNDYYEEQFDLFQKDLIRESTMADRIREYNFQQWYLPTQTLEEKYRYDLQSMKLIQEEQRIQEHNPATYGALQTILEFNWPLLGQDRQDYLQERRNQLLEPSISR